MMMNEFGKIDLACTAESLIPSGPGYTDLNHQTCTLPGSVPGSNVVSGSDYVRIAFQYATGDLWRNWGIIIALIVAFLIANAVLGEYIKWGAGGKTVTFFAKENKELKELNMKQRQKREQRHRKDGQANDEDGLNIASKAVLTWEDICYDVPVPSGQLRLLNNIYGYVKPGQLTALMGASGAGKTTLLDVLATRKNIGVITGDKLVDGKAPGIAFQRGTSYAEQLDVHEPAQTVREALRFSADLRQPYETPQEEKYAYVEEIISLLEMEDIADAVIGEPESGLAVEQRKVRSCLTIHVYYPLLVKGFFIPPSPRKYHLYQSSLPVFVHFSRSDIMFATSCSRPLFELCYPDIISTFHRSYLALSFYCSYIIFAASGGLHTFKQHTNPVNSA